MTNNWSKEDDEYLMANYKTMSYRLLSENLNRSEHGIRNRLKILGAEKKKHCSEWSKEEDEMLIKMYEEGMSIKDICFNLGRSAASVRLRTTKKLNAYRDDRYLRVDIKSDNFYYNLKRLLSAKTAKARCCLCGYCKHIDLHHKDGNRKNHHKTNIASVCPNCHREVEAGEHEGKDLKCIWWRVYSTGKISEVMVA